MNKDFHSRCDNKGPTITLFKIKDGDCVGGYTRRKWYSDYESIFDRSAFLFNLQEQRQFINRYEAKSAIYSLNFYGPTFTGDFTYCELGAD